MRMKDVHDEVERLLEGAVSFQSVADFLIKSSKGPKPLFEKPRYGTIGSRDEAEWRAGHRSIRHHAQGD